MCQSEGLVAATQPLIFISGRYDIRRNGRYTIVNCGKEDAARLAGLLNSLRQILRPSLYDVSFSEPSPAFRTFFGTASNVPYVEKVLLNVTTGISLYPSARQFHQTGSPLLVCATAGGQVVTNRDRKDYYYECVLDPFRSLIAISGTPYIVICPYFFLTKALDSPPAHNCLTMDSSTDRFLGTGSAFTNFKVLALLDGILRYYLYATTRLSSNLVTDVDTCVRLGARQKVENPSNYVYYIASEFFTPIRYGLDSEKRRLIVGIQVYSADAKTSQTSLCPDEDH